jgi:hypothetical protein
MINKNQNRARLLVLGVVVVVIIIVVIVMINKGNSNKLNEEATNNVKTNYVESADGTKVNTSEQVSEVKKVENVLLEQSKIVYNNGTSLLTSKVTNNAVAKDNLKFKVKFMANDGSVIAESVGFVGKIKANETKYIDSYITLDISNSKNVVYELMQ